MGTFRNSWDFKFIPSRSRRAGPRTRDRQSPFNVLRPPRASSRTQIQAPAGRALPGPPSLIAEGLWGTFLSLELLGRLRGLNLGVPCSSRELKRESRGSVQEVPPPQPTIFPKTPIPKREGPGQTRLPPAPGSLLRGRHTGPAQRPQAEGPSHLRGPSGGSAAVRTAAG